jgi:hypothetical protein
MGSVREVRGQNHPCEGSISIQRIENLAKRVTIRDAWRWCRGGGVINSWPGSDKLTKMIA